VNLINRSWRRWITNQITPTTCLVWTNYIRPICYDGWNTFTSSLGFGALAELYRLKPYAACNPCSFSHLRSWSYTEPRFSTSHSPLFLFRWLQGPLGLRCVLYTFNARLCLWRLCVWKKRPPVSGAVSEPPVGNDAAPRKRGRYQSGQARRGLGCPSFITYVLFTTIFTSAMYFRVLCEFDEERMRRNCRPSPMWTHSVLWGVTNLKSDSI